MLQFINDNTIEETESGITVQIYTNPKPLEDYHPYSDFYVKGEYLGQELVAVWLNDHEDIEEDKARTIVQNALHYYLAHKEK